MKPGQSIELLKALHILTRDGKLNQDSRRKLKQVYHLYQFIEPILQDLGQGGQRKAEVTAAASGIQGAPAGIGRGQRRHQRAGACQIRPRGMHGAAGIGLRARLVLLLHKIVVIAGCLLHGCRAPES